MQCAEVVEVRHQFVVMLQCFAEAEAGVGYHVGHAHLVQAVDAFGQVQEHLASHVVVVGGLLHGGGRALHVHQHVGHVEARHGAEHLAVHIAARDVVDDVRAFLFHSHAGHAGPEGVDRHGHVGKLPAHHAQAAAQAFHLLFLAHVVGTGTRGIGTHVDHVGALVHQLVEAAADVVFRFGA